MAQKYFLPLILLIVTSCSNIPPNSSVINKPDFEKNAFNLVGTVINVSNIFSDNNATKLSELLIETNQGERILILQNASEHNYYGSQKVRVTKRNGKSRVIPFDQ